MASLSRDPSATGQRRKRVAFFRRQTVSDGAGNFESQFKDEPEFTLWARVTPLLGGEVVLEGRLQGTSPVVIAIKSSRQARCITPGWRAQDIRTGEAFNIKSISNPDERNIELSLMCESGNPT